MHLRDLHFQLNFPCFHGNATGSDDDDDGGGGGDDGDVDDNNYSDVWGCRGVRWGAGGWGGVGWDSNVTCTSTHM